MENMSFTKALAQNQRGFSLIEILIALTLLAIAGTFVVGRFNDTLIEGKIKSAKIQMSNLDARLKEFRRKCSFYPSTEQGLEALISKPTGGRECKDYPPNGFIDGDGIPKDPWDNDYVYESDGKTYNIYSYGDDGEAGGEGNEADIYLRAPKGGAAASGGGETGGEAAPAE
ncbi:type II secretion system protein GspG [Bacteriovorax stolpii]|uniref:Type II secretion system protein GspG n=1 Tax=Bacteriovorax stolpii TaxID=960 RepID=A0A2K9NS96_BACTC|nr:type II secretion system major pseudopilin GspG [Bacteriovorax stolpii]AUN97965.1 type II secretion system protein GspG [Bacteriovorax stolpii]QDK42049.1 type II secretion system protein GspG [Bacteriovorax stolpii]TDP51798.1 type II secretion system protein G (GspG) [Bacteriovorax stolpii]